MKAGIGAGVSRRGLVSAMAGAGVLAQGSRPALAAPARPAGPLVTTAQRRWSPPPAPVAVREGLAPLPGVNLYYWDTGGDGAPIVLLHPATGSAMVWGYQQRAFAAAGHRVIAYSRRGHARSEGGSTNTGLAVDDLNALMDHLKVGRFHLLGSAAGGFIVPDYALSHGERLLSMTLASTQGGVVEPAFRDRIAAITPPPFVAMPPAMREVGPSYRAGNPAGVAAWEALEHTSQSGPERVRQDPKNRLLWADIGRIGVRTLIFTGDADMYMPVPLMLEYASHLRNARAAIVAEAGHSAYWEQPEAFNRLVLDFVGRS